MRVKTGRPKGGQTGHEKHSLEKPDEAEVTDVVRHCLDDGEYCPKCYGEDCTPMGEADVKYEYDVQSGRGQKP